VIVCANFIRNLAFYRTGHGDGRRLLDDSAKHALFWRQVNSNAIDILVLDWCKLFADKDGNSEHGWRRLVSDPASFEAALLSDLGLTADQFKDYCQEMRTLRDKFIAHLD